MRFFAYLLVRGLSCSPITVETPAILSTGNEGPTLKRIGPHEIEASFRLPWSPPVERLLPVVPPVQRVIPLVTREDCDSPDSVSEPIEQVDFPVPETVDVPWNNRHYYSPNMRSPDVTQPSEH